jgi:molybdate transport system substrate-binding protein
MVGELGGNEVIADATQAQRRMVTQTAPQRRHDPGRMGREQLLDCRGERAGKAKRRVDRGSVAACLDGRHELAAHTRASGKLGLAEIALQAALAEHGSLRSRHCQDSSNLLRYWQQAINEAELRRAQEARAKAMATAAIAMCLLVAGCGGASNSTTTTPPPSSATVSNGSGSTSSQVTVYAAASLTKVFPMIDANAKYTFGGSGMLEVQIEQGAPADVFAAASPKQPAALYAKGLVDKPVEFATNTLVLIVPRDNPAHITSVSDITRPGVKLVTCNATVPCGDYARTAFKNLGITSAAMKNIVSQTTDVTQTVADVATGQADAGFVYITDAKAADGKVSVVRLPAQAKPGAKDFIAVVKASKDQAAAQAFVHQVLSSRGQAMLRAAGFGAP